MAFSVLVVDDSDAIRERLADMLGAIGGVTAVEQVSHAAGARHFMATRWADVIVLDIALPDGSGIDLLHAVRQSDRPAVVVMLTNYPSAPYRKRCLGAGADFFLDKSTEFERLTEIVSRLAREAGDRQ